MSDSSRAIVNESNTFNFTVDCKYKEKFWQRNGRWALDGGDSRGRSRNTWLEVRKENSLRGKKETRG